MQWMKILVFFVCFFAIWFIAIVIQWEFQNLTFEELGELPRIVAVGFGASWLTIFALRTFNWVIRRNWKR